MNEEYLNDLYSWISQTDESFKDDVDLDSFKKKMSDANYAKSIYDWVGSIDKTFSEDISPEDFNNEIKGEVKKKEDSEPTVQAGLMDSELDNTSLASESVDVTDEITRPIKSVLSTLPVPSSFSDFFTKATVRGLVSGDATDETMSIMYGDNGISDSDIDALVKADKLTEALGSSESTTNWENEYNKSIQDGNSESFSWLKATYEEPSFLFESGMTSLARMASTLKSPEALERIAAISGTSSLVGAGVGLMGGPLAPATSTAGAISYAIRGGMSAINGITDATASFNEFLKEELGDKEFNKENIKAILSDKAKYDKLVNRSLKRGVAVGAISFITQGVVGKIPGAITATGLKGFATKAAATTATGIAGEMTGEVTAQVASGQEISTKDILTEGFAVGPTQALTAPIGLLNAPKYKINNSRVSEQFVLDRLETATDDEILGMNIVVENDEAMSNKVDAVVNKAKIKKDLDPSITDEQDINEVADKEIEIKSLKNKDTRSAKNKVKQLESEIDEIQSKYAKKDSDIVEDIQISDLEQTLRDEGVQFQLSTEATNNERKAELLNIARKQIKESQDAISETTQDVYSITDSDVETIKIDYDATQPLAKDISKSSVKDLANKKVNLVMADQLKVADVKTSTGKVLTRMGGVFFSAIPELKNKIAWASIDRKAARDIVRGSIKSDETVVFNMAESAIDSNKALIEYALEEIEGRAKNKEEVFNNFKSYVSSLKFGDQTDNVLEFLSDKKTFKDVIDNFDSLNTEARAAIAKAALPTESVDTKIPYLKNVVDLGVTIESARDQNIEPALKGVPMGSLLSTLEITDENGNKITNEADIDKAIVSRDQAIKEGLPIHENYPFYIRGKIKTLISETTPFWNVIPEALNTINVKVAGVVKGKKGVEFTAKQARGSEQRRATMQAAKAQRVESPQISSYQRFVNLIGKSIPGVNIVTDSKSFEEFRDDIYAKKMITKNQKVYGAVRGNSMYLNPSLENYNTPVHEFGHVWTNTVKQENPEIYNTGINLIQNSEYTKQIKESKEYSKIIKGLKNKGLTEGEINSYINEEALATAIGDKGESFAKASMKQKFKEWLQSLYNFIITKTGISKYTSEELENITLDEFVDAVVVDLLSGKPLFEEGQVKTIDELQLQTEDSNIYEIIRVARNNGFPDSIIEKFLLKRGFSKKEINSAKKINVNALQELPASFYNATDTAIDGLSLFENTFEYARKRVKKYGKDKSIDLAIENFLKNQQTFKRTDDIVREDMIRDFSKFMNKKYKASIDPESVFMGVGRAVVSPVERTSAMNEDMKNYKMTLRDLDKGAKNLMNLQREVRNFVRKYTPVAEYKKSEVNKLIKLITDTKTDVDVAKAISEVEKFIMTKHNNELERRVNDLINYKTTSKQSGKAIGRSVSVEVSDRLNNIKQLINNQSIEDVEKLLMKAEGEKEINDLLIVGDLLSSREMDESSFPKMQSLSEIEEDLRRLINQGKNQRALKKLKVKFDQKQNKATALEEIYGFKVDIDNLESVDVIDQQKRKRTNQTTKTLQNLFKKIDAAKGWIFSDMTDVMDLLSRTQGEMIGGKLEEMVTMRFKQAENTYKSGKMLLFDKTIIPKLNEIFGKKHRSVLRGHSKKEFTGIILDNGIELELSQVEAMYLYNQSKDEANNKSFEKKYGENYKDILSKIERFLDPKIKQWADYQTDELYPMLYDRYNEVYREMYDTNLPWNSKYAGRIYREGVSFDEIDMINKPLSYRNSVAGASTKERINSSAPIKEMDANMVLSSYLQDMEQFRAYATSVRDIDALFKDNDVRKAIERTSGKEIVNVMDKLIQTIANRGQTRSNQDKILNSGIDLFVASRLGLNPIIAIKQLTSIPAFTSDIGPINWVKYAPSSIANIRSTWKEISDNSPFIQDRYNKSIQDVLTASKVGQQDLVPSKVKEGVNKYVQFMLSAITLGDKGGVLGGIPNYLFYKDQFKKKNPKATEQQAIDYAVKKFEYDTSKAQQSYDLTDRDLLQTNPYARPFNVFLTTPKQYMRKEVQFLRQLRRQVSGKKYKGTLGSNLYGFALYHVALPMIFQAVSLGYPFKDWEDDDKWTMLRAAILGNINGFFILGDLSVALADYIQGKPWAGDFRSLAILEAFNQPMESWDRYAGNKNKDRDDELFRKAMFDTFSIIGAPISAYKYTDLLYDYIEKDMPTKEFIMRLIGYSETVAAKKKEKPKKKRKMIDLTK